MNLLLPRFGYIWPCQKLPVTVKFIEQFMIPPYKIHFKSQRSCFHFPQYCLYFNFFLPIKNIYIMISFSKAVYINVPIFVWWHIAICVGNMWCLQIKLSLVNNSESIRRFQFYLWSIKLTEAWNSRSCCALKALSLFKRSLQVQMNVVWVRKLWEL